MTHFKVFRRTDPSDGRISPLTKCCAFSAHLLPTLLILPDAPHSRQQFSYYPLKGTCAATTASTLTTTLQGPFGTPKSLNLGYKISLAFDQPTCITIKAHKMGHVCMYRFLFHK